jgi:hypothetical protein
VHAARVRVRVDCTCRVTREILARERGRSQFVSQTYTQLLDSDLSSHSIHSVRSIFIDSVACVLLLVRIFCLSLACRAG